MAYLRVKVLPRSSRNEVVDVLKDGEGNETLKIRIKAPAEKGKANAELIKFLASHFKVEKDKISILSGKTDQLKLIKIENGSH